MTAQSRKLPLTEKKIIKKHPHELVQGKQTKSKHRAKHAKRSQNSKAISESLMLNQPKSEAIK